jgi:hypothetical protein
MSEIHFYTQKKTFTNIFLIRFFTFLQISGMSTSAVIFRVALFIKKENREKVSSNGVAIYHDGCLSLGTPVPILPSPPSFSCRFDVSTLPIGSTLSSLYFFSRPFRLQNFSRTFIGRAPRLFKFFHFFLSVPRLSTCPLPMRPSSSSCPVPTHVVSLHGSYYHPGFRGAPCAQPRRAWSPPHFSLCPRWASQSPVAQRER